MFLNSSCLRITWNFLKQFLLMYLQFLFLVRRRLLRGLFDNYWLFLHFQKIRGRFPKHFYLNFFMFLLICTFHLCFHLFLVLFLKFKPIYNFTFLITARIGIVSAITLDVIGSLIINLKLQGIIELVHTRGKQKMMGVELK